MNRGSGANHGRHSIGACALICVLLLSVAACKDSEESAEPRDPTVTTATSPKRSTSAWEDLYTTKQLAAYRAALARWSAYKSAIEPINAAGKATPAAKRIYQEYLVPWQTYFKRLQTNESARIQIARSGRVLDSKATRIKLAAVGDSVTIRECVDGSDVGATQNGKPLMNAFADPQLSEVILSQVDGRWLVTDIRTSTKNRPCEG